MTSLQAADQLFRQLDPAMDVTQWTGRCRLRDPERAAVNLQRLASLRIPLPLLHTLVQQLACHLPQVSDADMALNNLERFCAASRNPLSLAALFERDPTAMPVLLNIFSTSQFLTDLMIRDQASYDALRLAAGQPVTREILIDELDQALSVLEPADAAGGMAVIRRFRHRETLRIAFGDLIGKQDLETVTGQISHLADAVCAAALQFAFRKLVDKHGHPRGRDGQLSTMTVIAMGKLGGQELNYSSDIDLVFFYRADGETDGPRPIANRDFFDRAGRQLVKLLSGNTPLGVAYRVDMRLRPGGQRAPLSCSAGNAASYYDLQGRTWERQALVKARAVAGDLWLGERLLRQLHNWVYERRLTAAEINGIKALKRQIERRALEEGDAFTNLKTGHGGIRDIEFAIQFLQLLHGGELPEVRTGNTLEAIARLYRAGCLNSQEQTLLDAGYRWLRQLEHRLQIMFDLQTHSLPDDTGELARLARRMGLSDDDRGTVLQHFRRQLESTTRHNRTILDHLLHDAFAGEETDDAGQEADLVLDSFLPEATAEKILERYGFRNPLAAHRNLTLLATERNRFLSGRRCRHFLAAIARQLLTEIATTPQPDETLLNLTKVSDSLGGKAAIWELFSNHPPSLKLYVRLCACCEYLCNILTTNPGMIDELTDALVMQELPSQQMLRQMLGELLAGAEDVDPIIHSFKDAHHLRVGIRDITGQDEIARTHLCLSDIAEVCVGEVVELEHRKLVRRFGQPVDTAGQPLDLQLLALGKLGGREPNYHSDLDIVFLYDGNGQAFAGHAERTTSHQEFFSRLATRVIKRISGAGPWGRLYEIDSRLRPTGKSGSLVTSLSEFRKYFLEGSGQLWERLALCKARLLDRGNHSGGRLPDPYAITGMIHELVTAHPWRPEYATEVADMRMRMQEGASLRNIKRGRGGTVDVEFAIQLLQLKFAADYPEVLVSNTVQAAAALCRHGLLSRDDHDFFCQSWQMLRWVEARLRLMNTAARHDLPESATGFANLAMLLRYDDHQQLKNEIEYLRRENRRRFTRLIEVHSA
jgi:glutamate-ammonia-ligase adenylyltransferase